MTAIGTERLILRCGTLIDGTGSAASEDVELVIDQGLIASIGPWSGRDNSIGDASTVRDYREHTVIPGVIDGHAHICLGSPQSAGWASAERDPVSIVAWGLASGLSALVSGVTTIVDVGSVDGLALKVASLVDGGLACGPRILAAGRAITTTGGHGAAFGVCADTTPELVKAVRSEIANGADLIKIMVTGGAITPKSNRRRAQYDQGELTAAISDAHRLGRLVVGHANATEGITWAVRSGIDIIAHCNWLGAEAGTVVIDFETVDAMAERGTWVDLNIEGALRDIGSADGIASPPPGSLETPKNRWELLAPLRDRGVNMYLTSDAFGPSIGSFTRSLCDARTICDLSAEKLVELVSEKPARALGLAGETGSITVGKRADLVVLDGDLRSDPLALIHPRAVFRDGVEVVADRMLQPPRVALRSRDEVVAQEELLRTVFRELD